MGDLAVNGVSNKQSEENKILNVDKDDVRKISKACAFWGFEDLFFEKAQKEVDEIIEDVNEYVIEIGDVTAQAEEEVENIEEKIEKLKMEIQELEEKEEDGSITEDEEKELETKRGDLQGLQKNESAEIDEHEENMDVVSGKVKKLKVSEKLDNAESIAQTHLERGQSMANYKVRRSFFARFLGITKSDEEYVESGKKKIEEANEFIGKIDTARRVHADVKEAKDTRKIDEKKQF